MSFIQSAPSEIISHILQELDSFTDLLSAIESCKEINAAWRAHNSAIIWEIGKNEIPAFDEALLVVRATGLVSAAYQKGELPPSISPDELTGESRKPNQGELVKIFDLSHLVRCIEHLSQLEGNISTHFEKFSEYPENQFAEKISSTWSLNFHHAVYRFFLSGAVLARAYQEPFHTLPDEKRVGFLKTFSSLLRKRREHRTWQRGLEPGTVVFNEGEVEYMREHAVYDFEDYKAQETIFAPFADWLLKQMKRKVDVITEPSDKTDVEEEIGRLVFISCKLGSSERWSDYIRNMDARYDRSLPRASGCMRGPNPTIKGDSREVEVVFLGHFHPEEVLMPDDFSELAENGLLAFRSPRPKTAPKIPDLSILMKALWNTSGRTNHRGECAAPKPPLQFFDTLLRRGLKKRISDQAFGEPNHNLDEEPPWRAFEFNATIFNPGESEEWVECLCDASERMAAGQFWTFYGYDTVF